MDFFIGTYWLRLSRDGNVKIGNMLPDQNSAPANALSDCSIVDLERDGQADILFALTDGRLFVYQTEKGYKPEWLQWPTQRGNFRHTGAWQPPLKSHE